MSGGQINAKRQRFVSEYLVDLNATQAAVRAGYSAKTAGFIGHQLLQNPDVRAAVDGGMATRAQDVGIEAADVLRALARLTFYDARKLFTGDLPKMPGDIDDETAAAIIGIDVTMRDGELASVKYKLADKNSSADKLMRHLGLYERDNAQQADPVSELIEYLHARGSRLPIRR